MRFIAVLGGVGLLGVVIAGLALAVNSGRSLDITSNGKLPACECLACCTDGSCCCTTGVCACEACDCDCCKVDSASCVANCCDAKSTAIAVSTACGTSCSTGCCSK